MRIKVKKLREDAKMPFKAKDGDFCYDMFAACNPEIAYDSNGRAVIYTYYTGIAFEIVRGDEVIEGYTYDVCEDRTYSTVNKDIKLWNSPLVLDIDGRPRSSIYKTGLSLCNCEATIDEGYRGEVVFKFYNIIDEYPKYKKGDSIGQVKIGLTFPAEFIEVDELNMNTERGEGGFGSSNL